MTTSLGAVLRQAREVRALSRADAAKRARISGAYLSKLENDGVKRPSPTVLHGLADALGLPYAVLMTLTGYELPEGAAAVGDPVAVALFADVTQDERDELLKYLSWYRARGRSSGG